MLATALVAALGAGSAAADGTDGPVAGWERSAGTGPVAGSLRAGPGVLTLLDRSWAGEHATDSDGDQLSDRFELRWAATDPFSNDSDGDGLRDAAEDPDRDGLGNLGEERASTSPLDRDTDGDGITDDREDADRDGIGNALEQDRRPVPADLVPSLGAASRDLERAGCWGWVRSDGLVMCKTGDRDGTVTVVLFGDSHASVWLTALAPIAAESGWMLVAAVKSGCPSVDIEVTAECTAWRHRVMAFIAAEEPDVVVVTNLRQYGFVDRAGNRVPPRVREGIWRAGLERTLRAVPSGTRTIVLADVPNNRVNVPKCLARHRADISACETQRSVAVSKLHDAAERAAASATGATFLTMNDQLCPYDPCPVVVNELLVWRNASHLTATYVAQMRPSLAAILRRAIRARGR